jgi:hypothetical protein
VSNEVTTVCTMQGYNPTVSIEVSVGVCILSPCILTRTIRRFSNEQGLSVGRFSLPTELPTKQKILQTVLPTGQ